VIVTFLVSLVVSVKTINYKGTPVKGIKDFLLIYSEPLNQYFLQDIARRNLLLIVCSAMIDIMSLTAFFRFAMYSATWRFAIAMILFYVVRGVI